MKLLCAQSRVTTGFRTTIPAAVRSALGLARGDRLTYTVNADGSVVLTRCATRSDEDPVLAKFLDFLAKDVADPPEQLMEFDQHLRDRLRALVGHIPVDLNQKLRPEDD